MVAASRNARWGFGSQQGIPPSTGTPDAVDLSTAAGKLYTYGAKGFYAAAKGPGVSASAGLSAMGLKSWTKTVSNFKLATSAAATIYGVYDAGGLTTDFTSFKTVDQLRATASFTSCMSAPYDKLTS